MLLFARNYINWLGRSENIEKSTLGTSQKINVFLVLGKPLLLDLGILYALSSRIAFDWGKFSIFYLGWNILLYVKFYTFKEFCCMFALKKCLAKKKVRFSSSFLISAVFLKGHHPVLHFVCSFGQNCFRFWSTNTYVANSNVFLGCGSNVPLSRGDLQHLR